MEAELKLTRDACALFDEQVVIPRSGRMILPFRRMRQQHFD